MTELERTPAGLQYVIPGAERMKSKRRMFQVDGNQLVIPGAERISTAEHLARLAAKPLRPRRRQVGLVGTGLFGGR
jgi:hypothetical protein